MSSHLLTKNSSSRSLNLNKSFVLSIIIHLALIFGITFTTFYELSNFYGLDYNKMVYLLK